MSDETETEKEQDTSKTDSDNSKQASVLIRARRRALITDYSILRRLRQNSEYANKA